MAEVGRWGWHELDSRWAQRLVDLASIEAGDLVLDLGAGRGAITERLVDAGARVIAIELHPRRAAELRIRFANQPVTVVRVDLRDLRLPRRRFKVVGNPPWSLTTTLVRRLTASRSELQCASLVLPAWAVARWAAGRGVGGITSKRTFRYQHGARVPRAAFRPAPPNESAILIIRRA